MKKTISLVLVSVLGLGAEVAADAGALAPLKSADGGMYIGAGKGLEAGSLWLGLIDDVRIYNRAITP